MTILGLLCTTVGLAAASTASITGPFVDIVEYRLGAGSTPPAASDTGLSGATLYAGAPSTYANVGSNTKNIVCNLPPAAGPFTFQEIGLFLAGGVLFARYVWPTPQTKLAAASGSNVQSSFTFNCLITLAQGNSIISVSTALQAPDILEIDRWSNVVPPAQSSYPDVPAILVMERNNQGDTCLLTSASTGTKWSMASGGFTRTYMNATVVSVNTASVTVSNAEAIPWDVPANSDNFSAVVEFYSAGDATAGTFRSLVSIVASGSNYVLTFVDALTTLPAVGSLAIIHSAARPTPTTTAADLPLTDSSYNIPNTRFVQQLLAQGLANVCQVVNGVFGSYATCTLNFTAPQTGNLVFMANAGNSNGQAQPSSYGVNGLPGYTGTANYASGLTNYIGQGKVQAGVSYSVSVYISFNGGSTTMACAFFLMP